MATAVRRWLAAALAAAMLLGLLPAGIAPVGAIAAGPISPDASTSGAGPCTGAPIPSNVSGVVAVDGGPTTGSPAASFGLSIGFALGYEVVELPENGVLGTGCVGSSENVTTDARGAFGSSLLVPGPACGLLNGAEVCRIFTGPYGPVSLAPHGPVPVGYAFSSGPIAAAFNGPIVLAPSLVWELGYVTLRPSGGPLTVSAGAPFNVSAEAAMQNGSPTDLLPTFSWTLSGAGWSFVGGNGSGADVGVVASPGAAPGSLAVVASARLGTTTVSTPAASLGLVAVATTVTAADLAPTAIDAGQSVNVTLHVHGALGYTYRASVEPGLGAPSVPVPCTAVPSGAGTVDLACATSLVYPTAGAAQPFATVTNGFSSATWAFPGVAVAPYPTLAVLPDAPVGYPGAPVAVSVVLANGTGVPPFAPACLAAGPAPVACAAGPGPSWSFAPTFPAPGSYAVTAWTVDGAGTNVSATRDVSIVAAPALGPLALDVPNVTVGVPVRLAANFSGGELPGRFWWNVSGSSGPWSSGPIVADGELAVTYLPSATGAITATLAVADALGSVVRGSVQFEVAPAPAVTIAAWSAPPPARVVVGTPVALSWAALDREGNPAIAFSAESVLSLGTGAGASRAWANASGVGPLRPLGNGTFELPAAAWVGGVVRVGVVPGSSGVYAPELLGSALPNPSTSLRFQATSDPTHLRLFAPTVALAEPRASSTFWLAVDRFGNPVPGAVVSVRLAFGATSSSTPANVERLPNGSSGVWVNFTAPGADSGTVVVLDSSGATVLGPLPVAALSPPTAAAPFALFAFAAAPAGAAAVGVSTLVRRRHRPSPPANAVAVDELRSLAEGRARVVAILGSGGPRDLAGVEAAWEAPAPPALADWLASLLADGTVTTVGGPDGRPRFALSPRFAPPRVELDVERLEAALRFRDEDQGAEAPR